MSALIDQWISDHWDKEGHYAGFVGFESTIHSTADDVLQDAYDQLDIYERVALYGFVCDLLEKEARILSSISGDGNE